jgi:hypothetical protein
MVHVRAKTILTEPVRPEVRQQQGWREEWRVHPGGGRAGRCPARVAPTPLRALLWQGSLTDFSRTDRPTLDYSVQPLLPRWPICFDFGSVPCSHLYHFHVQRLTRGPGPGNGRYDYGAIRECLIRANREIVCAVGGIVNVCVCLKQETLATSDLLACELVALRSLMSGPSPPRRGQESLTARRLLVRSRRRQ